MKVYTAGSPRFIASALSSTVGVMLPGKDKLFSKMHNPADVLQ